MLIRAAVDDDPAQGAAAREALAAATLVAITIPTLCEFVWVLSRHYRLPKPDIAAAIRAMLMPGNVVTDRPAMDAGLAFLDAGGDFADGAIAHAGRMMGGPVFLTFDEPAAGLARRTGGQARAP